MALRIKGGTGCVILFALSFLCVGVLGIAMGVRGFSTGEKNAWVGIVAGVVFLSVGAGVIALTRFGSRVESARKSLEVKHPNAPWLWREDWARGEVKSGARPALMFIWCFTFFWNAIAFPVAVVNFPQMHEKPAALLVLLFPIAGIGLLIWAVRATIRLRRFGESVLKLKTLPGVTGGKLAGVIHTARPLVPAKEIRLRLLCFERDSAGDTTSERLQWEDEKTLSGDILKTGSGIPVLFNIPFECKPTATLSPSHSIVWRLEVSASVPGTDYRAQFEVPVFQTAESSPTGREDEIAESFVDGGDLRPPPGVVIQAAPGGITEFIFRPGRNVGAGVVLALFTLIWTGSIWLMFRFKAPVLFPIIFGLFDLLLIFGVLHVWTAASRIAADEKGLAITKWFCLIRRERFLSAAQIGRIETKLGMSSGSTTYYDVIAITEGGKKVTLASSVRGKRESEWLARQILYALGRS